MGETVITWIAKSPPAQVMFKQLHDPLTMVEAFIKIEKLYFLYKDDPNINRQMPQKAFARVVVMLVNSLRSRYLDGFHLHFNFFLDYWNKRPRMGGIVLDCTSKFVLLVRPPHTQRWSFPKRKLEPRDIELVRATREIREETGLQFPSNVNYPSVSKTVFNSNGNRIEMKMFLMPSICIFDSEIHPQSTQEIGGACWFHIDYLSSRSDQDVAVEFEPRSWQSIKPFLGGIRREAYRRTVTHHHDYEEKSYGAFRKINFD